MSNCSPILHCSSRCIQALMICAVMLAGCELPGLRDQPVDLEGRAAAHEQAGNYRAAAQAYERLAARASSPERDRWLMQAAESWYNANERNRALNSMRAVRRPVPTGLSAVQTVLAAAVEVENGAPREALERLKSLPEDAQRSVASDALAVGSSAWFTLGDPARGVELLIERELWIDTPDQLLANQRRIWEGLRSAGAIEVPANADPVLTGWLELGNAVVDRAGDPFAERAALLGWRQRWPDHPAVSVLLEQMLDDYSSSMKVPQRVALLLPLSGRLSSAGEALRDGFIAAYLDYGQSVSGMEIIVHDTERGGAEQAYRQAVGEKSDFIVGPLVKEDVEKVVTLAPAGPPTLALNYLPETAQAPRNFFQFALAPEHEARRVAQQAVSEARYRAIALVPANNWGRRIVDAFASELESHGGTLLDQQAYDQDSADFSGAIMSALHLDRSRARHRALVSATGQPMEFEPRRRQDVDFIFFAAQAQQARLMKPQLRFHYASDLPVYATAAAFEPDPDRNRDIEGLIFAATPWKIGIDERVTDLQSEIDRFWPQKLSSRNELYAMGFDAWRLVPLLAGQGEQAISLNGLTGQLSLRPDGRIERSPALAKVEDGVPSLLTENDPVHADELQQGGATAQ